MMSEENEDEDRSLSNATYQNAGIVNLKKSCIRKLLSLIQEKKHKKLQHVHETHPTRLLNPEARLFWIWKEVETQRPSIAKDTTGPPK